VPAAPATAVAPATIAPQAAAPVAAALPPATVSAPSAPPAPASPPAPLIAEADKQAVLKEAKATVPADARLMSSTVAGDRIVLTYEHFAGTLVLIFDPETLEMVGRLEIAATP
jgi:hypothetical protein